MLKLEIPGPRDEIKASEKSVQEPAVAMSKR
jgi:hypothetical protein